MKFDILHSETRAVIFTADIDCAEDTPRAQKLRLAVIEAQEKKVSLAYFNLTRADLSGLDLSGLDFTGALLIYADLSRANLSRAILINAFLIKADFTDADLSRADLTRAFLTHANLFRTNLTRAILVGAILADANLTDAVLFDTVGVIPLGSPNGLYAYAWLYNGWLFVRIGPYKKRLDEARAFWAGRDDRREVMAALDYAEILANRRGWPIKESDLQAGAV